MRRFKDTDKYVFRHDESGSRTEDWSWSEEGELDGGVGFSGFFEADDAGIGLF